MAPAFNQLDALSQEVTASSCSSRYIQLTAFASKLGVLLNRDLVEETISLLSAETMVGAE